MSKPRSRSRRVFSMETLEARLAMSGFEMHADSDRYEYEYEHHGAEYDAREFDDSRYSGEVFVCCESYEAPDSREYAAFYVVPIFTLVSLVPSISPSYPGRSPSDDAEGESRPLSGGLTPPTQLISAPSLNSPSLNSLLSPREPLFTTPLSVVAERPSSVQVNSPGTGLAPTTSRAFADPAFVPSTTSELLLERETSTPASHMDSAGEWPGGARWGSPSDVVARRLATDLVIAARESATASSWIEPFVAIPSLGNQGDDQATGLLSTEPQMRMGSDSAVHAASEFDGERTSSSATAGRDDVRRLRPRPLLVAINPPMATDVPAHDSPSTPASAISNGMVEMAHATRSVRTGGAEVATHALVELVRMGTACARHQMFDIGGRDIQGRTGAEQGADGVSPAAAPRSVPTASSLPAVATSSGNAAAVSSDLPPESASSPLLWALTLLGIGGSVPLVPTGRERILSWTAAATRRASRACRGGFRLFSRYFRADA